MHACMQREPERDVHTPPGKVQREREGERERED